MFSGLCSSLEVIWGCLDVNCWLQTQNDERNRFSIPKNDVLHALKEDLVQSYVFRSKRALDVIWRSSEVIVWPGHLKDI